MANLYVFLPARRIITLKPRLRLEFGAFCPMRGLTLLHGCGLKNALAPLDKIHAGIKLLDI